MISAVIPHVPYSQEIDAQLTTCIKSLTGYQELVLVVNDMIGYGAAFNRGLRLAKGDFIIGISNDTQLLEGTIEDLCVEGAFTYPVVNDGDRQWGCFFCISKTLYDKIVEKDGYFFDERFKGAYFEDNDLQWRLEEMGIPIVNIPTVKISHIGGKTVKDNGKESEYMDRNKLIFREKWGRLP